MATATPPRPDAHRRQPPDQHERDRIEAELRRCMVVEAGPGAGKTDRLIIRLLALLGEGDCSVGTVAAITFTRKAAAELRSRFQVALERAVRSACGHRKPRLAAALRHVEQANIGTIHSFCARLLRERPVEAGVDVAFQEIDENADDQLRREAWAGYVADLHFRRHTILDELDRLGLEINQLEEAFGMFVSYPDVQHWPAPELAIPDLAQVVEALRPYAEHMGRLSRTLRGDPGRDALLSLYRKVPRLLRQADTHRPATVMDLLEHCEPLQPTDLVQRNWPGGKAQALAELDRWNQLVAAYAAPCRDAWRAARYRVALQVLRSAQSVYDRLRQERGWLNFADLLLHAARLLREHPGVRRYFRTRFTHLLVDEFQDTDPVQAEVMFLLTADDPAETDWRRCRPVPGSLFIVGDPKQSIYRFRRADIVTYNQVKDQVRQAGGAVVELWANFRSRPQLVDWINATFTPVFPAEATPHIPARRPMETGRGDDVAGDLAGTYVLRAPSRYTDKDAISAYEADQIARTIRQALDAGLTVPRTAKELQAGVTSAARPGDFLIVTWTASRLGLYARKLQEYCIPCQATGSSAWEEVPELRLLALCLAAITRPHDPIALVAVLRSELFGFSDPELYELARAGGRFSWRAPLPDGLEESLAARLGDTFDRLQGYHRWLLALPPVAAVEKIVADLGLLARAAAGVGGNDQAGTLAKALELLRTVQADLPSVTKLVAWLDHLMDSRRKFNGVPARSPEGSVVRLMNLHQVKGLEAPVVFLADPTGAYDHPIKVHVDRTGAEARGYLAIYDPDGGFSPKLLACPPGWDQLAANEGQFQQGEALRKFHVAATRAGSQLTISQRVVNPKYDPWAFFGPRLANCLPLPEPAIVSAEPVTPVTVTLADAEQAATVIAERWASIAQPTYRKGAVKELALSGSVSTGVGRDDGLAWGVVIHGLFQMAATLPGADLERRAVHLLNEQKLDTGLAPSAIATVEVVRQAEFWKRALRSRRRLVEVPFQTQEATSSGADGLPLLLSGVIDLVFREEAGWVIVDYKTDPVPAEGPNLLVAHYRPQVIAYATHWQQLIGEPVVEVGLYFTHTGAYVTVPLERRSSLVDSIALPGKRGSMGSQHQRRERQGGRHP